tara:strand:- start:647 stop:1027 length:381 start_codon:yes stop_codon:yes gene_type:complete
MMKKLLFISIILLFYSNTSHCQDLFEGKERNDLGFKYKSRVLKTSFNKIDSFKFKFFDSKYTLEEVLREKLYTSIHLNQTKNQLISYDGTVFNLPDSINSFNLTLKVVELIGDMYFGQFELKNIDK